MTHPAQELQSLIYAALDADAPLTTLIGPGRIYDEVPQKVTPPYLTFGKSLHLDWSTDTESGMEHEIEIHAWTNQHGRKQVLEILELVNAALATLGGIMSQHYLVNITHEQSEVEAKNQYRSFLGISTFRAITEPIA